MKTLQAPGRTIHTSKGHVVVDLPLWTRPACTPPALPEVMLGEEGNVAPRGTPYPQP